jgi:hypothetical protein
MQGTPDTRFALRAERSGAGEGRTYTVVYGAVDQAGNVAEARGQIQVPLLQLGMIEPLHVTVDKSGVAWSKVSGAHHYNVIRTDLDHVRLEDEVIRLDPVVVLAEGTTATAMFDEQRPESGKAYGYLVEYDDGAPSGYGTESAGRERVLAPPGACP